MKRLREKLDEELLAYAWVGEMQERGAVHYHMYILVQAGADVPRPDESEMWKRMLLCSVAALLVAACGAQADP